MPSLDRPFHAEGWPYGFNSEERARAFRVPCLGLILRLAAMGADRWARRRSLTEHLNTSGAGGMLTLHIIAAMAEFELQMIRSRTKAGLANARAKGRIGGRALTVPDEKIATWKHLGPTRRAKKVGLSKAQFIRRVARLEARG